MPRKLHNALTPIAVKNAGLGRHADGGGLYLRVQNSGARSWLYRSIIGGKTRDVGMGPAAGANALSLAQAREKAKELALQSAKGEAIEGKRIQARKAAAQAHAAVLAAKTFKEVAEAFIDRKEGGWRNDKHRQQWRNTLASYAYPHFGAMPVGWPADKRTSQALPRLDWGAAREAEDWQRKPRKLLWLSNWRLMTLRIGLAENWRITKTVLP